MPNDIMKIHIPDAIKVNELLLEYMTASAVKRTEEINAFIQSSNKTNILIMEVFKGLIANRRA
ncbi:MAG: hypothetical protein ACOZEN_08050 [Thermodesulfobacteriota bacterium]